MSSEQNQSHRLLPRRWGERSEVGLSVSNPGRALSQERPQLPSPPCLSSSYPGSGEMDGARPSGLTSDVRTASSKRRSFLSTYCVTGAPAGPGHSKCWTSPRSRIPPACPHSPTRWDPCSPRVGGEKTEHGGARPGAQACAAAQERGCGPGRTAWLLTHLPLTHGGLPTQDRAGLREGPSHTLDGQQLPTDQRTPWPLADEDDWAPRKRRPACLRLRVWLPPPAPPPGSPEAPER